MSNIEAFLHTEQTGNVPFIFDPVKVLAPDNISVQMTTHGMWLAAESYRPRMNILDLGSGSGILAVSAMLSATGGGEYSITAVDVNDDALETTRYNLEVAQKYARAKVGYRVLKSDWLESVFGESYDLILCNPPYLARDNAISHRQAFTAPVEAIYIDDPIKPYEAIAKGLQSVMTDAGIGLFRTELSELHRDNVREVFNLHGFRATGFGLHDLTREGAGLTVYRSHSMPPGLVEQYTLATSMELSYEGLHDGGTKKPLSEAGKYWNAVAGYNLPE